MSEGFAHRGMIAVFGLTVSITPLAVGLTAPAQAATTITVTSAADSGPGTLRQAVIDAEANATEDHVRFSLPADQQTITLTSALPTVSSPNALVVDGADAVTIAGSGDHRLLRVGGNGRVYLENLTLADGAVTCNGGHCGAGDDPVGGAIRVDSSGYLEVSGSTLRDNGVENSSLYGYGGAISNEGTTVVTDSEFQGNLADYGGGAIANWGTLSVDRSTFVTNSALDGAALHLEGTATIRNSTFYLNSSSDEGVIWVESGDVSVSNSTMVGNTFVDGSAIVVARTGQFELADSVVTGNSTTGYDVLAAGEATTGGGNLLGSVGGPNGTAYQGSSDVVGVTAVDALGQAPALADHGGPTRTVAITSDGLAFNHVACGADAGTDQRGVARPQYVACDSGAYEYDGGYEFPPAVDATGADPTFVEDGAAVALYGDSTATTGEAGQEFESLTFTVTGVRDGAKEQLVLEGANVPLVGGGIGALPAGGTWESTTDGTTVTIVVTDPGDDAAVSALLTGASYRHTGEDPTAGTRDVTLTEITDSGTANSTAAPDVGSTVTVVPVNDRPAVTATAVASTYAEGGGAVDLFDDVAIDTVETGQHVVGLTVTVDGLADGSAEVLGVDGTDVPLVDGQQASTAGHGLDVDVSVSGTTATVSIGSATGLTEAEAAAVVDGLGYRNDSAAPHTGDRTVTLTEVTDDGGTANGGEDTATLAIAATVGLTAVNAAPVPADDELDADEDEPASVSTAELLTNDTDADGDALTVTAVGNAGHGQVALNVGTVTYTPDPNWNGDDSFTYTVSDGNGASATGRVDVTVTPVDDIPTITAIGDQTVANGGSTSWLPFKVADADGLGALAVTAQSSDAAVVPAAGIALAGTGSDRTVQVTPGTSGASVVTLTVTDPEGHAASTSFRVTVTVTAAPSTRCTIRGSRGRDVIVGTRHRDVICGLAGNDVIYGLRGDDVLRGGAGSDRLVGGRGADRIEGGTGADVLLGGRGRDLLHGGPGKDRAIQ